MNDRAGIEDFGPIYQETDISRFPVEPFNALSNIVFLIIIVYWALRVYPHFKNHRFIGFSLPVLLVGFIGGTVYHATRSHAIWLFMDFMPILILTLMTSIYFWRRITGNWLILIGALLVPFILRFILSQALSESPQLRASLGYSTLAVAILIPIIYYAFVRRKEGFMLVVYALLLFAAAVTFRYLDGRLSLSFLYMGTHWLWHIFGGLSTHFLIAYIYRDDLAVAHTGTVHPFFRPIRIT